MGDEGRVRACILEDKEKKLEKEMKVTAKTRRRGKRRGNKT